MTAVYRTGRFSAIAGVVAGALLAIAACRLPTPPADPQLVSQWMRTSLAFSRSERLGPPVASRISAYAAIALYEGYASDVRSPLKTLGGQLNGFGALPSLADGTAMDGATVAAEAVRVVLDSLLRDGLPSTRRTIDSLSLAQIAARSVAGVDTSLLEQSRRHGRNIATAILGWAAADNFYATRGRPWAPSGARGEWVNTATVAQFVPQTLSGQSDLVQLSNPDVHVDAENATAKGTFTNRPKAEGPTTLPAFNPTKETGAMPCMTGSSPKLLHLEDNGIVITINENITNKLDMAGRFTLEPQFIP